MESFISLHSLIEEELWEGRANGIVLTEILKRKEKDETRQNHYELITVLDKTNIFKEKQKFEKFMKNQSRYLIKLIKRLKTYFLWDQLGNVYGRRISQAWMNLSGISLHSTCKTIPDTLQSTYRKCMTYKAKILKLGTSFWMEICHLAKAWCYLCHGQWVKSRILGQNK